MSKLATNNTSHTDNKSLTQLFVQDFQLQHGKGEKAPPKNLETKKHLLFSLFSLDWLLCHLVIGPSVVACWRGVWDYSHVWLEEIIFSGDIVTANIVAFIVGLLGTGVIDMFHSEISNYSGEVKVL